MKKIREVNRTSDTPSENNELPWRMASPILFSSGFLRFFLKTWWHQISDPSFFFYRVNHNRPLCNLQPVAQCEVCERPLPLAACSLLAAVMVVAASSVAELVLELLYNGFYSHKNTQRTQYRICEEAGVCKDQRGCVLRIFAWLFTYDRGIWGDQWWWLERCYWGLGAKYERAREDITAPFK